MFGGMYTAATASDALQTYQQIVAENLSHINTPGYRRKIITFESFLPPNVTKQRGELGHIGTTATGTAFDFEPGHFQQTQRPLDLAIDGVGFFELDSTAGPRYTRSGVFFLGQDNTLVSASGIPVMGMGGQLQMPPNTTPDKIAISEEGAIRVDGTEVGRLKVVAFEDAQTLELDGAAVFKAKPDAIVNDTDVRILQGQRELSNVSATHELIKMITGVRHHEAAQRALRAMSDALQQRTRPR